uniref:40S ribosomal protein S12 n=1 Tax=Pseudodiaptomus poplesia TaxID=213370 RepID=A0A1S6GLF5_9MAXI|nr:40S ribosomal protein S12 [Pseudodiaptomus poplesia]
MSDVEGDDVPSGLSAGGPMDINTAIQEVLRQALIADGLSRGLRESAKALDKRQALLCILSENCEDATYKKLISALCIEHAIPLIKVDSNMKLGEWAGLYKIDQEGKARKVVKCSACVIKDWGKESPAHDILREYLKSQG